MLEGHCKFIVDNSEPKQPANTNHPPFLTCNSRRKNLMVTLVILTMAYHNQSRSVSACRNEAGQKLDQHSLAASLCPMPLSRATP